MSEVHILPTTATAYSQLSSLNPAPIAYHLAMGTISKATSHSTTPPKKTVAAGPSRGTASTPAPAKAGDRAEVKKEPKASSGAQSMAAGLSQNFGASSVKAAKQTGTLDPGQAAVEDARKFLGQKSETLKGKLENFQAAGGKTNNCADFVSANLMNNGLLEGKQVNVDKLREQLQKEGWSSVEAAEARPGDVAFYKNNRHVELVSEAGGTRSIGSNNQDPVTRLPVAGQQWVTERDLDPAKVTYWHRPQVVD
ncbi:MAG: hypothetical protein U0931_31630 [Vulcanimicrobiota bacterium]